LTVTETSDVDVDLPSGYYVDPDTGAWCSLPWPTTQAGVDALLRNSLGPQVIDWAEWRTDEPGLTDPHTGEHWEFTRGQKRFLILWYAYDPATGRWLYRSGVKRGAKGTGKDPFGASLCNIELLGPSQLDRVRSLGFWRGVRHGMPLVQVASNSEAQSKDMMRVANAQWNREAREFYGLDCGETRTVLKDSSGRMEILTASESSSEGDPATFIALNESHHMTQTSGGHRVAAVARRNVGKSPAYLQARLCEFTNAHAQGSDSVAERSYAAWQDQVSGKAKRRDILYDSIEAPPDTDIYDESSLLRGIAAAYMDAPWADHVRLVDEVLDSRTSVADTIRFYLNGLAAAEDAWIDPRKFDSQARDFVIEPREPIAMFLDCSKSDDATGLVACRISDGHVFVLGVWQKPHGHRGKNWLAPREEVDAAVRAAFVDYEVVWFGVDPSPARDDEDESLYWMPLADAWHRDFRKKLKLWATPGERIGHSVLFDMRLSKYGGAQRNMAFTEAAMQTAKDIDGETDEHGREVAPPTLTHDGNPALRMHTHQAKARPNKWGVSLGKVTRDSSKKVDLAVCMVGARMGRRLALNSGKVRTKRRSGRAAF
jgi:hypothetical protein